MSLKARDWQESDAEVVASWWDSDYSLRQILGPDPAAHLDDIMPERVVITNGSDAPIAVAGMRRITPDMALVNIVTDPKCRKGWNAIKIARLAEGVARSRGIRYLLATPFVGNRHSRAVARWLKYRPIPNILMIKELA